MDNVRSKGKFYSIISDTFSIPVQDVTGQLRAGSIEKWDSLGHLNLFLAIEDEMGIKFSSEEIINLSSVKEILRKICEKVGDE